MMFFLELICFSRHMCTTKRTKNYKKNLHFISELLDQNDETTEFSIDDLIYENEKNVDNNFGRSLRMEREKQNFDIMDIMKINPDYNYNYPILGGLS